MPLFQLFVQAGFVVFRQTYVPPSLPEISIEKENYVSRQTNK
jgi:hypothetical protein